MKKNNKENKAPGKQKPAEKSVDAERDKQMDKGDVCEKAPEWAEHQRFWDDDEPCDDGRTGRLGEK